MNKIILVPLETAKYLGFDNEDDHVTIAVIDGLEYAYKEIDIATFVECIGVPDNIKLTIDYLYN